MFKIIKLTILTFSFMCCCCAKTNWDNMKCKFGDIECLPNVINHYIKASATGVKSLNLIPTDPLFVPRVDIIQGSKSPVNIELILKNSTFYGLSDLQIKQAVGFEKDPKTSKFELYGMLPKFTIIGKYEAKGHVIVLPVVGNGDSNLTFANLGVSIKMSPKIVTKSGKDYAHIEKLKLHFNTTRLYTDFGNLYNGDKLLGDATNDFIRQNWMDILEELKPALQSIIGKIVRSIMVPLFEKFPYDELFLKN